MGAAVSEGASTDRPLPAVEAYAAACLEDLRKGGGEPRPLLGMRSGGGWTILVVAVPTPPADDHAGLSECQRDCLRFLAEATEPLSAARVRRGLEKWRIGVYSEITVKHALAHLKRCGIVGNNRIRPRGYYLPNHYPLFGVAPELPASE